MNARILLRSTAGLIGLGLAAACSSAPESTGSSVEQALSVAPPAPTVPVHIYQPPPPPPEPPAWPTPGEAYCSADATCNVGPYINRFWEVADPSLLTALDCTQAYAVSGSSVYPHGAAFAVCFDDADVRATFPIFGVTCDACLPELPAGQIYVWVGGPLSKPNCPSGCPK